MEIFFLGFCVIVRFDVLFCFCLFPSQDLPGKVDQKAKGGNKKLKDLEAAMKAKHQKEIDMFEKEKSKPAEPKEDAPVAVADAPATASAASSSAASASATAAAVAQV